jgi:RNA polymerase sigma factor (sigma-70 family)
LTSFTGDQPEAESVQGCKLAQPEISSDSWVQEIDFPRLIEQELPFLRKTVRRWHRDKANADDLVQDTVVQALANAHLWRPGSNLRAWLITVMRNQFLAAAGRSKRCAELLATIAGPMDAWRPEICGPRLLLRDVERGLRRLTSVQRTVLLSIGIDGKSYSEVAQTLGLTVGAVRCHLVRARKRLRAAIEGGRDTVPFAPRPALRKAASTPVMAMVAAKEIPATLAISPPVHFLSRPSAAFASSAVVGAD